MAPPDAYPIQKAANELQIGMGPPNPPTPPAPDEWMRRLGTLPLMHQPGEQWMYNTGSDVLGVLIARAVGPAVRDVPARAHLRAARHEGHRLQRAGRRSSTGSRPATGPNRETGALELYDDAADGQWSRPPAFPSGAGGLVSTVDDYLAFGQMMLNKGRHGERAHPVAALGRDHDDRPADARAEGGVGLWSPASSTATAGASACPSSPGATTCRRCPGRTAGTAAWAPPGTRTRSEDMVTILMTQRAWTSPSPPDVCRDFWTLAYQAIDD